MPKPSKLTTLALAAIFLWSTLGAVCGSVICEHGSLSDIHIANHADRGDSHDHKHAASSRVVHRAVNIDGETILFDQYFGKHDDHCKDRLVDFARDLAESTSSLNHPSEDLPSSRDQFDTSSFLLRAGCDPKFGSPPRVSQSIRSHRTVVLLI